MEFFDTIKQVKSSWQPYKKWDIEQQKKDQKNAKLNEKYPVSSEKREDAKQYGRTIVDVINTMDQYSIDKSEDADLVISTYVMTLETVALGLFMPLSKVAEKIPVFKKTKSKTCAALVTLFFESEIIKIVTNILRAKYEKQASRIARFQTREQDLKDSRNFVVYNQEQINKAKDIAKTLPEPKETVKIRPKGFHPIADYKSSEQTVKTLAKGNAEYQKWNKKYLENEISKKEYFKKINPSQEELGKAERDRDALLHTVKKIEFASLDYLNNMSMALSIGISGLCIGAFAGAAGLNLILKKMSSKMKILNKNPKIMPALTIFNFAFLPGLVPFLVLSSVVKLQKNAARVGRFKAKQDLLNHPEDFIGHDDNQRKEISDKEINPIKNKSFIQKLSQDFKEIKNFKKDYAEYDNYMKTQHKDELKLNEALKQIDISDVQKKNSIKLQKDAFQTFEKMDEKAQRFTDDTNAAVNITSNIITGITSCTFKILGVVKSVDLFTSNEKITSKKFLAATIPFLIPKLIHPIIKVIGTRFKKDAGKIGVMNAMQDLNDPKNFLNDNFAQKQL